MASKEERESPAPRGRRWRRRAGFAVLLFALVALAPSAFLSFFGTSAAESLLGEALGTKVNVLEVSGGWLSGFGVSGLGAVGPGVRQGGEPEWLLVAREIESDAGLLDLLFSDAPIQVTVRGLQVLLPETLEGLQGVLGGGSPTSLSDDAALPGLRLHLEIEDGEVLFGSRPGLLRFALDTSLDGVNGETAGALHGTQGGGGELRASWNLSHLQTGHEPLGSAAVTGRSLDLAPFVSLFGSDEVGRCAAVADALEARWAREAEGPGEVSVSVSLRDLQLDDAGAELDLSCAQAELAGSLALASGPRAGEVTLKTGAFVRCKARVGTWTRLAATAGLQVRVGFDGEDCALHLESAIGRVRFEERGQIPRTYDLENGKLLVEGSWSAAERRFDVARLDLVGPRTQVRLTEGRIDASLTPGIATGHVEAIIPAAVVTWIDSDIPRREGPVHASGDARIPLRGDVLVGGRIEAHVRAGAIIYEGRRFVEPEGDILATGGIVSISRARARFDDGRVQADLQLPVRDPEAARRIAVSVEGIPLTSLQEGSEAEWVSGTLEGRAEVCVGPRTTDVALDLTGHDLRVAAQGHEITRIARCSLSGLVRAAADGSMAISAGRLVGGGLDVAVLRARLRPGAAGAPSTIEGLVQADEEWLAAAPWLPGVLVPAGDGRLGAQLRFDAGDLPGSISGDWSYEQDAWRTPLGILEGLKARGRVTRRRLEVIAATASAGGGTLEAAGEVPLGDAAGSGLSARASFEGFQLQVGRAAGLAGELGLPEFGARLAGHVTLGRNADGGWVLEPGMTMSQLVRRPDAVDERHLPGPLVVSGQLEASAQIETITGHLQFEGQEVRGSLEDLRLRRRADAIACEGVVDLDSGGRAVALALPGLVGESLQLESLLGVRCRGNLVFDSQGALDVVATRMTAGIDLPRFNFEDQEGRNLHLDAGLERGILTLAGGSRAGLGGGTLLLRRDATLDLAGRQHPFTVALQARQVSLVSARGQGLAFVNPLLLSERDQPGGGLTATLDVDLDLAGTWSEMAGWSRSVQGTGRLAISDGVVVGSTIIGSLAVKAPLALSNAPLEIVSLLTGQGGSPLSTLTGLASRGYHFEALETPVTIDRGRVRARPDLKIESPEMELVLNGWVEIEGAIDYHLKTDLIGRLALKSVTDLPGKIPLFGALYRTINPLQLLDQLEFGATIEGNLLERREDGSAAIDVQIGLGK